MCQSFCKIRKIYSGKIQLITKYFWRKEGHGCQIANRNRRSVTRFGWYQEKGETVIPGFPLLQRGGDRKPMSEQ